MSLAVLAVRIANAGADARPDLRDKFEAWSLKVQEQTFKALGTSNGAANNLVDDRLVQRIFEMALRKWTLAAFGRTRTFRQVMTDDLQAAMKAAWDDVGFFDKGKLSMKAGAAKTIIATVLRVHTDVIDEVCR